MKVQYPDFIRQLEERISQKDYQKALQLILDYPHILFGVPHLNVILELLKQIPNEAFATILQKLVRCWVFFLCGEYYLLTQSLTPITEDQLANELESSLYYSLKAIVSFMTHKTDGIRYAKMSVDVLKDTDKTFYLANARLTYGQLLSSCYKIQEASVEFYAAYHLFRKLGSDFLSMVAITNYGLKKHSLGQMTDMIQIFHDEITSNSRLAGNSDEFFEVLKLPLGMAFFELNKLTNAKEYLESARKGIFSLDYVHMYGAVEPYLCYTCALLKEFRLAHQILDELIERIGKLKSKNFETLFALLRVDLMLMEGLKPPKAEIEFLELHFLAGVEKALPNVVLTLGHLKLKGFSAQAGIHDILALSQLLESQKSLPLLQQAYILLAEFCYRENQTDICEDYLKKAIAIYEETRMCVRFKMDGTECVKLIKKLSPGLYEQAGLAERPGSPVETAPADQEAPDSLTARELEILSYIASGNSNEEIAKKLFISVGTTKWHINNIFSKLQIKRRSQAAAYYHQLKKTN